MLSVSPDLVCLEISVLDDENIGTIQPLVTPKKKKKTGLENIYVVYFSLHFILFHRNFDAACNQNPKTCVIF